MSFEISIETSRRILESILSDLEGLTEDNFQQLFPSTQNKFSEAMRLKASLENLYSPTMLKKYEPELSRLAKLIREKFDNILAEKRQTLSLLETELHSLQNHKKITYYGRSSENKFFK